MGLLDILNGMQNGPRGPSTPGKGGMSPITMAILALLAYKAIGKMGGGQAAPGRVPSPMPSGTNASLPGSGGGGLGDLLQGGLGGLLGGGLGGALGGLLTGGNSGSAGNVLSGGLNDLVKKFHDAGHGDAADSWVGGGQNADISESALAKSIGADQIKALTEQTGLSQQELLAGLREQLPGVIDALTPHGRVPSGDEMARQL